MLKKYLLRNLKILSLMVALMALNTHGAATSEEGVPKAPYRLPTLNGQPLEKLPDFPGLKSGCGFFVLEVDVSAYKQASVTLDGWGIRVGNMQLGQGSTDVVPFLQKLYRDNVAQIRQLKRGGQKVFTEDTFAGGMRAHIFDVRNPSFSNDRAVILDMTREVRFNCDAVTFGQPVLAICPEDMQLLDLRDGETKSAQRVALKPKSANLTAVEGSDIFVEGGIVLAPVSGKRTWLKSIVFETHADARISPYVGLMGHLQFSPPATKGSINGLMAVGAKTVSFIIGPEDAVWDYEDHSAPFQLKMTAEGISMHAGAGPEDNRYVLSIPKGEAVPEGGAPQDE